MNIKDADDAEIEEVEASTIKPEPGQDLAVQVRRHPKMENVERDYVKQKEDEMEIDIKLDLKRQIDYDNQAVLKRDIDELTSSNDYVQVNDKVLNKMFSMSKLKSMYFWFNVKSGLDWFFGGALQTVIVFFM